MRPIATSASGPAPSTSQPLPRGAALGRYVVLEHVATGGMGTVYAAYDPQLDRRVALKVIRPRRGTAVSQKARDRLRAEAQALARLNHPNVVSVHDVAEEGDRVFVAMEFVEGQELGAWLRTTRTWQETLEVFLAAARGLAAAHGAGLVHRDFKPPNVLVGADGRVRVADFGIARRDDDVVDGGDDLLGTPAYMSPEQARGVVADARSDQFSWCVSLYEALFGKRPFDFAALREVTAKPLEKPDLGPVPPWAWAALKKGLSWNPAERFASMDALLTELQSQRERTPRRWALWLVPAAAAVVAVTVWTGDRNQRQRACELEGSSGPQQLWNDSIRAELKAAFTASGSPRADDAFTSTTRTLDTWFSSWSRAAQSSCLATRVNGVQTEPLYTLRKSCFTARLDEAQALVQALQHADKAMVERATDAARGLRRVNHCDHPAVPLPVDPTRQAAVTAATAELRKGEALYHLGKNAEAITALTAVATTADTLDEPLLIAEVHNTLGLALAVSGDAKGARLQQHQAAIGAERANDDELKARAWSALALVEGPLLGNVEEGERMSRYALAAASHLEHAPEVLAMVRSEMGQQAQLRGDWPTALAQSKAAVEALGPLATDDEELMIAALQNEALALSKLGKFDEALVLFRRSIAGCTSAVGERHPRCINSLMNLGNTLKKAGKIDEAAVALQQVVDLREQIAPGSSDLGAAYSNLAQTLEANHRLEEARAMYEKALAILEKTLGAEHPNVAIVHANLCNVHLQQQHWDTALTECDRAIALLTARVPKHPFIADLYVMEAQAQLELGDLKKAAASVDESTTRCDGTVCVSQLEPSRSFTRARLTFATSHDRAAALTLATRAREGFEKAKSSTEAAQVTTWLRAAGLEAAAP